MIISRTPYRISFFGGGTDYPVWFREHGGAVLSTSIQHYCYITGRFLPPFFEHRSRVVWSQIEQVMNNDEIEHPVVRAALQFLGISKGIEVHHAGDLPARSGLGSSSAFTVGLLHVLHSLQERLVTRERLAEEAIFVEQELLGESVGVQDQIQTAFGGFNRIDIQQNGTFKVIPLPISRERLGALEGRLLLFFTGIVRYASAVADSKIKAIPSKVQEMTGLRSFVDEGTAILTGKGNLDDFGRLLHESWLLKRSLSPAVAPPFVDEIYARARDAGAIGGKLLGAGGGGFMLFFTPEGGQAAVRKALNELIEVPVIFDRSGSQIIFYSQPAFHPESLQRRDFRQFSAADWAELSNDGKAGQTAPDLEGVTACPAEQGAAWRRP